MSTGSYVGNGTDNRNIGGAGFWPDVVIVKGNSATEMVMWTSGYMATPDWGKKLDSGKWIQNSIQNQTYDGFQVGTAAEVNSNSVTYYWAAFKNQSVNFTSGKYTGNGSNNRTVTGLGFAPDYVFIISDNDNVDVVYASTEMGADNTCNISGACGNTGMILSLNSNGFTLGTSANVNSNGVIYYYIAGKYSITSAGGSVVTGSYTGNASDNRNISCTSFTPGLVFVKPNSTSRGVWRFSSMSGDLTGNLDAAAPGANMIQALNGTGFQVGTSTLVNANSTTYYYIAMFENGALPVALSDWKVSQDAEKKVMAQWVVSRDEDVISYTVERSPDSEAFTAISTVPSGSYTAVHTYSVQDEQPLPGAAWYRIRQDMKSGDVRHSDTYLFLNNGGGDDDYLDFACFPNPSSDPGLNLYFPNAPDLPLQLSMTDVSGKLIWNHSWPDGVPSGRASVRLPADLPAGIYMLNANAGPYRCTRRYVRL